MNAVLKSSGVRTSSSVRLANCGSGPGAHLNAPKNTQSSQGGSFVSSSPGGEHLTREPRAATKASPGLARKVRQFANRGPELFHQIAHALGVTAGTVESILRRPVTDFEERDDG